MSKAKKNNNLLISGDYPLIASPTLAKAYGVAAANFLQKLHYCLENNEGKIFNGKKYWFHSYEQWQITLGVYSVSTIKRIVAKLKQAGILVIEKLAKNKWLQTNFYTINYKKLKQLITLNNGQNNLPNEIVPTPDPVIITPSLEKSAQAVQSSMLMNSIQQAFQAIKVKSNIVEPSLKVAKESRLRPDFVTRESYSVKGLSQPLHPAASKETLKNMGINCRCFYQALRQQRVDIDYDDQRIQQLLKYQKRILQHIAYIKQNFAGHERYQWHTFEQLQMENYLKK
ncbi:MULTISPECIES: hypothetical protein [unclassified Acinetobacter]|uniref:hypothetical protein n=1 Tax=unclassified Acinetobacter TaxID=196816 RepID=UPI001F4B4E69|nr:MULTISPECIES: hypothetical protein [unclassified Acinetobacter]MCH7352461.1 hypothetical protein [Acinetobacter sp. NIPH 2023]MCH7359854.1 hypothetical protein [Acinetobacter sp. NIPH 2024]